MEKKHQKDVTIDVCPRCHGLWLDDHEIDKLLSHGEKQKKRRENARKGGGSS
jgi:Zn-finger nucleic acid-binding protein